MVRSPALEVISYLKKTDFSKPATRYLFCILWKHKHIFSPRQSTRCFWKKVFCKPWQMVQMGWTALGRRCLSATPFTTVICRDGWCCTFPMVRNSTVTQQRVFFAEVRPVSDLVCFSLADNTAHIWVKNCKELLPSSYNTSRFDQPLQAIEWLRNFRITNEHFLSKVCVNFLIGPFVGSK